MVKKIIMERRGYMVLIIEIQLSEYFSRLQVLLLFLLFVFYTIVDTLFLRALKKTLFSQITLQTLTPKEK